MHDNWWRVLHDDEPPKSSWRPRKSTKSWDQLSVRKFTKVTQSRKQVHRVAKIGPTEPRLWAQRSWRLPLLRDFCNDLPEWIRRRRHGTFVLVRCGTRRWAYCKIVIFTTVHSGARRTSKPETKLSLSWRNFVASSVFFHTHKYVETRFRT